jgi:hypothetical protein
VFQVQIQLILLFWEKSAKFSYNKKIWKEEKKNASWNQYQSIEQRRT